MYSKWNWQSYCIKYRANISQANVSQANTSEAVRVIYVENVVTINNTITKVRLCFVCVREGMCTCEREVERECVYAGT
jgi:hypothetical protein